MSNDTLEASTHHTSANLTVSRIIHSQPRQTARGCRSVDRRQIRPLGCDENDGTVTTPSEHSRTRRWEPFTVLKLFEFNEDSEEYSKEVRKQVALGND